MQDPELRSGAVTLYERGLHRVQVAGRAESFDRRDAASVVHDCQRQARIDAASIDDHRACTALTVIAALLGSREMQVFTQRVEQRRSRIELEVVGLAVHVEGYLRQDLPIGLTP